MDMSTYRNGRFKLSRKDSKSIPSYIIPFRVNRDVINHEHVTAELDSGRVLKLREKVKPLEFEIDFMIDIRKYPRQSGEKVTDVINAVEFMYGILIQNINRISFTLPSGVASSKVYYYLIEVTETDRIDFSTTPTIVTARFINYEGKAIVPQ